MITNKTKVVKDQILDAETDVVLAKTFGNHKRAIQISETLNSSLAREESVKQPVENPEVESQLEVQGQTVDPSEVEEPVEVKESSVENK